MSVWQLGIQRTAFKHTTTHVTSPACTECHWCHPPDSGCLPPHLVHSYLRFYTAMPISKLAAFMEMVRTQLHSCVLGIHVSACNLYCIRTYIRMYNWYSMSGVHCAFCLCELCVVYVRRYDFDVAVTLHQLTALTARIVTCFMFGIEKLH